MKSGVNNATTLWYLHQSRILYYGIATSLCPDNTSILDL